MASVRSWWRSQPVLAGVTLNTVVAILLWPVVDVLLRAQDLGVPFGRFDDYGTYYLAAERATDCIGGPSCAMLYTESLSAVRAAELPNGILLEYVYPPLYAVAFRPALEIGYSAGAVLWGLAGVLALWYCLTRLLEALGWTVSVPVRLGLLVVLASWQPILYTVKQGEITTHLAALFVLAAIANERAREDVDGRRAKLLAGALTAVPVFIKPIYAPAGAHLLRDRWRLAGGLLTGAGLYTVSLLVAGVDAHRAYVDTLLWGKGWGTSMRPLNIWTAGYFEPFGPHGELGMLVRVLLLVGVIYLARRRLEDVDADRLVFALGLLAIPIAAPEAYALEFILLVPALAMVATHAVDEDKRGLVVVPLAVLAFHVQGYSALAAQHAPAFVQNIYWLLQPGLWACLALLGLATAYLGVGPSVAPSPRLSRS